MGDTGGGSETWADYLQRMTKRPGWSVAKLARESGIHRGSIFKWISGDRGMTVANVVTIAKALGDDPVNALRAAAGIAAGSSDDEEINLVMTDPRLTDCIKERIVSLILDRRARERAASLEETRRMIELLGPSGVG
ncbi:helix-turn-helix domain-containing protein [Pilimelia terevasa]|nr:helix-turn-helix transcriptional regulator [Pilimelia terevasa]